MYFISTDLYHSVFFSFRPPSRAKPRYNRAVSWGTRFSVDWLLRKKETKQKVRSRKNSQRDHATKNIVSCACWIGINMEGTSAAYAFTLWNLGGFDIKCESTKPRFWSLSNSLYDSGIWKSYPDSWHHLKVEGIKSIIFTYIVRNN